MMGWLSRKVDRRVEVIGRRRLELVEGLLRRNERVLHNAPAELVVAVPGLTTHPVILFATDQRLIWTMFDGTAQYRAVPAGTMFEYGSIDFGRYEALGAIPGRGRTGRWGGLGYLGLSPSDWTALPPNLRQAAWATPVAFEAAERIFGTTGPRFLQLVTQEVAEVLAPIVMFGFPTWTPLVEQLARAVDSRGRNSGTVRQ
jgi:hypothetical protein